MDVSDNNILKLDKSLNPEGSDNLTDVSEESVDNNYQNEEDRVAHLYDILKKNVLGCDLALCLFISALKSYRADRCLRPFPPFFVNNGEKDFKHLKTVCDNIPPIKEVYSKKKCSDDILQLLSWLFVEKGYPILNQSSIDHLPIKFKNSLLRPQYVFEVTYPKKVNDIWLNRRGNKDVFYAYHGSSVDNFYSILKVGLQQHFSIGKEVLFGNGIYLSNELSVCTQYAPFGKSWIHSLLGQKQSIIAVCEVINDINKVKCKDEKNKGRALNKESLNEIPENYFVVTDSDMLRVKYLLVYSCKEKTSVKSFLIRNLFWIALVLYFLMLVLVGWFKSPTWTKFIRWFNK